MCNHSGRWDRKMPGLLLLAACFSVGLSTKLYYGETFRMTMMKGHYLEFVPDNPSQDKWTFTQSTAPKDPRRRLVGNQFVVYNVTQADSGQYEVIDQYHHWVMLRKFLEVRGHREDFSKDVGDTFRLSFDLEPHQCNIYYTYSEDADEHYSDPIVRSGRLLNAHHYACYEIEIIRPCGIFFNYLQTACAGFYEIRDSDNNVALAVTLVDADYASAFGSGMGIFFLVAGACGCLTVCCRKRSKKNRAETPDDEPAVHLHESTHLGTDNPPAPVQNSTGPTAPLIHSSPPMDNPPPYSQVMASAPPEPMVAPTFPMGAKTTPPTFPPAAPSYLEAAPSYLEAAPSYLEAAPTVPVSAPVFPVAAPTSSVSSEANPQFELRMSSALDSDTAHSGVYTSDKLDFC